MRRLVHFLLLTLVAAEDGLDGWLRYAPLSLGNKHLSFPTSIVALNSSKDSPVYTAGLELQKGFKGILSQDLKISYDGRPTSSAIVVGTIDEYSKTSNKPSNAPKLKEDGFWLSIHGNTVTILGQNERGALYGAFEYLSRLAQGNLSPATYATSPDAPIRWVNHWDNLNGTGTHGSVERGYGGDSIFYKDNVIYQDLSRVTDYARLLASIRINGVVINNVNADPAFLTDKYLEGVARIASHFRPYGVKVGLSLNFASPKLIGGLDTFDPLDPSVVEWWTTTTNKVYKYVPDMAGYLVKANSEGQPGPLTYNRTLLDGANMFAKAAKPHGGIVMFRAFVYDSVSLKESDWKADRANAAVEHFKQFDGQFDDNVVVQIKYGPIDFQVREPASPLFANIPKTNVAIELQVTQEYLGQQCHLVYLPPLWNTILDFDLRVDNKKTLVRDVLSGERFKRNLGGYVAVSNVGVNSTWLGSHLAMSNLYAYGRMAWEPTVDVEATLDDWTRLTFGLDQSVINTISKMSMQSWPAYEQYTGNLGIQTLTDILYAHYGPNPPSQDDNPWGQWTRADADSIGMDRTVWNGTGFAGQYPPEVARRYEGIDTTPDDLLLWFHHVPYTHRLHSGKTVIQHFYDEHYKGAETAHSFLAMWKSLKGKIDKQRYEEVLFRLVYQAGHSIVWRDAINNFYYNKSGIADKSKRVGNHPWRIEAESMTLKGYAPIAVNPFFTASGFKGIVTTSNAPGTATTKVNFPSGTYDLAVGYYDIIRGKANWKVYINDNLLGAWDGDNEDKLGHWPSEFLDGHSATRITFDGVKIKKGDTIKIVGTPNGPELAPVDYLVLLPKGIID
ncbi:hypothetical protein VE00_02132 [Pseudogymnoascus sp. WSF 3629]|nr:hypothetical protein VE00_02132 [Pseudogymnoascus sp. WSF 3629]